MFGTVQCSETCSKEFNLAVTAQNCAGLASSRMNVERLAKATVVDIAGNAAVAIRKSATSEPTVTDN
jgi:hypothetical protein